MRVFACLAHDHNLMLVLLAAVMCVFGAFVSVKLFARMLSERGLPRFYWLFLSAVTSGSAIWTTHFIAMLGYNPGVPITFDATLTIVSALIAVIGSGIGLSLANLRSNTLAAICGGGTIGLAIAAMHYVGMFAYRVDGVVRWLPEYVVPSIIGSVVLSVAAIDQLRRRPSDRHQWKATALFVAAIVTLHFVGMAAFVVTPIAGFSSGADSEAFTAMAAAVAMVALLIVGTGITTNLVETRTRTDSRDKLRHQALHDALTQLANRRSFTEQLTRECAALRTGHAKPFVLLMIDLDRFKHVNDTLGHPVGDEVLRRVAVRLGRAVRSGDLVARLGGDEFAVIARDITSPGTAESLAQRIVEVLSRPFVINSSIAEIGGSVGLALAPEHAGDTDTLIQHADVALYTAKRGGRNRHFTFDPALIEQLEDRRAMESDLRRAVMREDFAVVYQPVMDTASGECTGAEALVRWNCSDRGDVPPSKFIPMAEELGLITRIGSQVLRRACIDAASWPDKVAVSVNVSPVQLMDPRLPQTVTQALEESGITPARLELEITETALLGNDEEALQMLKQISGMGVRISLDDFGTGYSSLSYLHRFPIDRIKIDRSFVAQLPDDPGSASIVRAIAQLGVSLDMRITAEGIETAAQHDFITKHGCSNMQGYLFSHPVPHTQICALFDSKAPRNAAA
ncbi:putative signaling protein [Alteripontixanthobacter maritimus]|uniref:Putative signaling protein n=1 Tax=Alteripontixanthobacter maritimus TaxID=2161824 RepID=A0A369QCJ9_9SPHN|nr:EAL domain-containing protein [Alteripontixanthobacter maritimus]RDC60639.1 putative signaling protein [Alteripontixanthobacter maritimus]